MGTSLHRLSICERPTNISIIHLLVNYIYWSLSLDSHHFLDQRLCRRQSDRYDGYYFCFAKLQHHMFEQLIAETEVSVDCSAFPRRWAALYIHTSSAAFKNCFYKSESESILHLWACISGTYQLYSVLCIELYFFRSVNSQYPSVPTFLTTQYLRKIPTPMLSSVHRKFVNAMSLTLSSFMAELGFLLLQSRWV